MTQGELVLHIILLTIYLVSFLLILLKGAFGRIW